MFFSHSCGFFGDFAIGKDPKQSGTMLSTVSKCRKSLMYLHMICVLDKLHSGMSYISVSHEFNVNDNNIY